MLRALIICPDGELSDRLTDLLEENDSTKVVRTIRGYASAPEVARAVRANAPDMIFLSAEHAVRCVECASSIAHRWPSLPLFALGRREDRAIPTEQLKRAGVREVLQFPFETAQLRESINSARSVLDRIPASIASTDLVFSVLPSKPGVGASTLAVNLAVAAGRISKDRTLLLDCDLGNGIIRFLLQLEKNPGLPELARCAFHLNETIWPQAATPVENLDVVHSGSFDSEHRVEPVHIERILSFATRNYDAVFMDLSGSFDGYSMACMERSRYILVIVTPELASVHLAREKVQRLRRIGFAGRALVIVNRAQKKSLISREQVEEVLKLPVVSTLPNDYHRVNAALTAGRAIDSDSELGSQIERLSAGLLDRKQSPEEMKAKLSGHFLSSAKSLFA